MTLTDILDGHAVLDISCLDRIYLNGYVPRLQTSGQVVGFLHHRGFPTPSPAALGRNGNAFRQAMERYAQANGIPWIKFGKDDRKTDVVRPLPEAADRDGRPGVVAIGVAQEFQWVHATTCTGTSNGIPPVLLVPHRAARTWPAAAAIRPGRERPSGPGRTLLAPARWAGLVSKDRRGALNR